MFALIVELTKSKFSTKLYTSFLVIKIDVSRFATASSKTLLTSSLL
jgi:hypothetical protein